MLRTRILVGVVALPILAGLIVLGGWAFALLVAAALVIGGDEYSRLMHKAGLRAPEWLTLALIALPLGATWFDHPDWYEPGLALLLILGALEAVVGMEQGRQQPVTEVALAVFGGVYIGGLGHTLLAVRELDEGAYLTLFLYGCVAVADSAAFFVGRRWGRRKLSPHVSPKKTWEGYWGGIAGAVIFGALAGGLPDSAMLTWGHGALIGLLIGVLGTVGDLAMSAVKRQVGAKDSGRLIPGHGGILDRIDSVLVAAAVGYYYLLWFVV